MRAEVKEMQGTSQVTSAHLAFPRLAKADIAAAESSQSFS